MAAPTKAANVKKALANSEPSTHGPKQTFVFAPRMSAFRGEADMTFCGNLLSQSLFGVADIAFCDAHVCF
jgi:hypothetical protein